MKNSILFLLLLIIFSLGCKHDDHFNGQLNNTFDSINCQIEMQTAFLDFTRGNLVAYLDFYNKKVEYLLNYEYQIQYRPFSKEMSCQKAVMDNIIFCKYGQDFYDKILKQEDTLRIDVDYLIFENYLDLPSYGKGNQYFKEYLKLKMKDYLINNCFLDTTNFEFRWKKYSNGVSFVDRVTKIKVRGISYGDLVIDFIINENGEVKKPTIITKFRPDIDNELIRLINNLPEKWAPAEKNGQKTSTRIRYYFTL